MLGETLSAGIGQSYNSFTPIQMAYYISTLANSYFALNKKEEASKYENIFLSKADRDMKNSYLEQKERLLKLLNIN